MHQAFLCCQHSFLNADLETCRQSWLSIFGDYIEALQIFIGKENLFRLYLEIMAVIMTPVNLQGIPEAPTFYPTEEEFADPLTYINKIRAEGEK